MWDWLAPVAGAVLGATQGGKGGEVTQSNTIDPRIANILYGSGGSGGLLSDAQNIYGQQMQMGGLNPMQRQGLDMQAQYLQSPQYTQNLNQLQQVGSGLLGAGIAGNPFTRSSQPQRMAPPMSGGYQYRPQAATQAPEIAPTQRQQVQIAPQVQDSESGIPWFKVGQGNSGGFVTGGGNVSTPNMGQGVNNSVASSALAAMAASENPALRALSPSIAALLGAGGSYFAGRQADAMGAAGDKLAASQSLRDMGIGTMSDSEGNVMTYSSPDSISAADARMFGGLLGKSD